MPTPATKPEASTLHPWEDSSRIADFEAAVASPAFSHARLNSFCRLDSMLVYHYDAASPSGFKLAAGLSVPTAETILRRYNRVGALSPTEPR